MMARMVQYVKEQGRRIRAWHDRHPRTALFILVSSIGIFTATTPALAQLDSLSDLASTLGGGVFGPILALLAALMYAVVHFLILLNSLFADMLISFVQYNDFVNARPVQIGWPLIRDIVNMLFIVVLLAVAFSTIIGYEKLHYKHILPKLLLMAVLINFSKTLVGVMIDFSQVITLTFVNGFKAAAFGNFAKAFSLTTFLDTMKGNDATNFFTADMLPTIGNVIVSLLFAIVVLTVTSTVLLIMTVYFIARIVILWVVLIFSPIAFFAWAVHGTPLEKVLHHATGEWSSKLTAALTGGPVVAFFLWLTLAVIQGADKPFDGLYKNSSNDPATTNPTILDVSRPENMTTMLVAIALLLTGLNTAVSVSTALDKTLGGLAGKIKSGGGPAGLAARYIAKPAAGKLDRKLGISKNFGEGLIGLGKGGGLVGGMLQRAGMKATAINAKRKSDEKKDFEAATSHESDANKLELAKTMRKSSDPVTRETGEKMMYELADKVPFAEGDAILRDLADTAKSGKLKSDAAIKLAKGVSNSNKQKAIITGQQKEKLAKAGLSEAEIAKALDGTALTGTIGGVDKNQVAQEAMAEGEASGLDVMRATLQKGIEAAEKGDEASFSALKDIAKKSVHLRSDASSREAAVKDILADPKRIRQNADNDVWRNTEAFDIALATYGNDIEAFKASDEYEALNKGTSGAYLQAYLGALDQKIVGQGQRLQMTKDKSGRITFATAAGAKNSAGDVMEYRPHTLTAPSRVNTYAEAVRGLDTATQSTLSSSFSGISAPRLDEIGKSAGGEALSKKQADHLIANSAFYGAPPPSARASTTDKVAALQGQAIGIRVPKDYRRDTLSLALTEATLAVTPAQQEMGIKAFVNTDMSNFENDVSLQNETFAVLADRATEVKGLLESAKGEDLQKAQTFLRNVYKTAQVASSNPSQPLALKIRNQMDAEGIGKILRRSAKT